MKVAFWNTVIDCMVEFFHLNREDADSKVRNFLLTSEVRVRRVLNRDIAYDAEPIHIASDLTKKEVDYTPSMHARYKQIQNMHLKRRVKKLSSSWLEDYFGVKVQPEQVFYIRKTMQSAEALDATVPKKKIQRLLQTRSSSAR